MSEVVQYLRLKGHFWLRINNIAAFNLKTARYRPSPYALPGVADLLVIKDNRPIFVELKAPKGRQSPDQVLFEKTCEDFGVRYHVVRSVEEVMELGL